MTGDLREAAERVVAISPDADYTFMHNNKVWHHAVEKLRLALAAKPPDGPWKAVCPWNDNEWWIENGEGAFYNRRPFTRESQARKVARALNEDHAEVLNREEAKNG